MSSYNIYRAWFPKDPDTGRYTYECPPGWRLISIEDFAGGIGDDPASGTVVLLDDRIFGSESLGYPEVNVDFTSSS